MHGENLTFKEVSQRVLRPIIHNDEGSDIIDVVFDCYIEQSIKDAEHVTHGC